MLHCTVSRYTEPANLVPTPCIMEPFLATTTGLSDPFHLTQQMNRLYSEAPDAVIDPLDHDPLQSNFP